MVPSEMLLKKETMLDSHAVELYMFSTKKEIIHESFALSTARALACLRFFLLFGETNLDPDAR